MDRNRLFCLRDRLGNLFSKICFCQETAARNELRLFLLHADCRAKQCPLLMDQIYRDRLSLQALKQLLCFSKILD